MKFYGVEVGCNKMITANKDTEVIAVTTFGEDITSVLLSSLKSFSSEVILEGDYDECPHTSPDVSKIDTLYMEKKFRPHHTYHYRVANYLVSSFLSTLRLKLPSNSYINLDNK